MPNSPCSAGQLCAVRHCMYIAESAIEDYLVCSLHDAPQVRGILEELKRPCAYFAHSRPIVLPCGDLDESDFVPRPVNDDSIHVWEDTSELMQSIPDTPSRNVSPNYDLTNTDYLGL